VKNNPYKGKFIVFEGLDGSGQTTQAKLLADFLIRKGNKVLLTKEPTSNSSVAAKIRMALDSKTKIKAEILQELFAQDRKEHLEREIIPALKKGKIVISDRYFFSSFAYGMAEGLKLKKLLTLNYKFLMPDITLFLRVKPETCLARIKKRKFLKTIFEKKKNLKKVAYYYEILANTRFQDKIKVVNGEKPIEEVFSQVKEIVLSKLNV
jgi:dTMP kinase